MGATLLYIGIVLLLIVSGAAYFFGSHLPGGFLPTEDQGYAFVALQLPESSSLQRTTEAAQSVEDALHRVPGVESVTSVVGFSLLSFTQDTYHAFFFVTLKDWDQRKSADQQFNVIQQNLAMQLAGVKQGLAFSFPPPAIPGLGSSGGVSFVLEDRTGSRADHVGGNQRTRIRLCHWLDLVQKLQPELRITLRYHLYRHHLHARALLIVRQAQDLPFAARAASLRARNLAAQPSRSTC